MLAFDPGQNGSDVPVLTIKNVSALPVVPGKSGETTLDRGGRKGRGLPGWCGQIGHIEPDHLGRGGQGICPFQPAPAGEVFPVSGVGLVGILGCRSLSVIAGGVDQPIEGAGTGDMCGQGD